MYGSGKIYSEVRLSLKEKAKKGLKNYVNLYWQLHVCINASAWIAGERTCENAHMHI